MLCKLCNKESNCIHVTSKYGLICNKCYFILKNSKEEKSRLYKELSAMWKRYGLGEMKKLCISIVDL